MNSLEIEFQKYKQSLDLCLSLVDFKELNKLIFILEAARLNNRFIFTCGNGGSNSTASHFANDLRSLDLKPKYRTVCLNDSTSITCIGNDFGYEYCFSKQLECILYKDDIVLGLSASGSSPNIINALQYADDHDGVPVSIVGFDGGRILEWSGSRPSSICLHTESPKLSYRMTEDAHMILTHFIIEALSNMKWNLLEKAVI